MSDERTTAWSLRVRPTDVDALRALARREGVRRGRDLTWADLVREAMAWMAANGRPVGT